MVNWGRLLPLNKYIFGTLLVISCITSTLLPYSKVNAYPPSDTIVLNPHNLKVCL